MPTYYKLDKIVKTGTSYRAEADKFFIIKAIGTDITDKVTVEVDGKPAGDIINSFAPLHKTESNVLGPFDLKDKFIVVPPDKKFEVTSSTSGKVRILGEIGILSPGEAFPGDLMTRYNAQFDDFVTYLTGSVSLGTDEEWATGRELTVLEYTPKTREAVTLDSYVMVKVSGGTITEGDVGIRFEVKANPLDILDESMGQLGIDALSMPYPPADATEQIPFTLEDKPITLPGDTEFKIKAINTSGGALTPASGSAWKVEVLVVAKYKRV